MTVQIITNISSKQHAGPAFFRVDGKKQKIKNDLVEINVVPGDHRVEIGYLYGGAELKHLDRKVNFNEADNYYFYHAPLLLSGEGKIKKISKFPYLLYRWSRAVLHGPLFIVFVVIFIIFYIFIKNQIR